MALLALLAGSASGRAAATPLLPITVDLALQAVEDLAGRGREAADGSCAAGWGPMDQALLTLSHRAEAAGVDAEDASWLALSLLARSLRGEADRLAGLDLEDSLGAVDGTEAQPRPATLRCRAFGGVLVQLFGGLSEPLKRPLRPPEADPFADLRTALREVGTCAAPGWDGDLFALQDRLATTVLWLPQQPGGNGGRGLRVGPPPRMVLDVREGDSDWALALPVGFTPRIRVQLRPSASERSPFDLWGTGSPDPTSGRGKPAGKERVPDGARPVERGTEAGAAVRDRRGPPVAGPRDAPPRARIAADGGEDRASSQSAAVSPEEGLSLAAEQALEALREGRRLGPEQMRALLADAKTEPVPVWERDSLPPVRLELARGTSGLPQVSAHVCGQ